MSADLYTFDTNQEVLEAVEAHRNLPGHGRLIYWPTSDWTPLAIAERLDDDTGELDYVVGFTCATCYDRWSKPGLDWRDNPRRRN